MLINAQCSAAKACRLSSVALLLASVSLLALFCEDSHVVSYRNTTIYELTMLVGDDEPFVLAPDETRKFGELKYSNTRKFTATTPEGQIIYSEDLRWADLRDRDWIVVVRQNQP